MITHADRHVGQIVGLLKQLNLERDTVLIVTSDNGAHRGEEKGFDFFRSNGSLRGEKTELYEGGIRVPFIVRWPGHVRAGSASAHVTSFCDIMPTLAELADAQLPANIDGISILYILTGQTQGQHEYLYWEHNTYDQKAGRLREERLAQAVRMGDWKALRVSPEAELELYNLRRDPAEAHNVAAAEPELLRKMEAFMKSSRTPPRPHNTGSGFPENRRLDEEQEVLLLTLAPVSALAHNSGIQGRFTVALLNFRGSG